MASDDLEFRMARRADMPSLLAFIQQLYPALGWTAEFMQWQYFDNPAGDAKVWICFDAERAVGSVTALPHAIWADDQLSTGYRVQDVLTDPDYRGRSIYRKLSEACYAFLDSDDKAVHFTFPNEHSDRVFRTSGWTPVGDIPLWSATPSHQSKDNGLPDGCRPLAVFSAAEEDIWASWRRAGTLGIDKNIDYLNWKYFGNPRADYQCFRMDHAQSNMVLVLKKFRLESGQTLFHLCDLFYSQFCETVLDDVFSFIENKAAQENASTITAWLAPRDELSASASAAGFSYSPVTSRSYFLRSTNTNAHEYFAKWNIRMGDSDVY